MRPLRCSIVIVLQNALLALVAGDLTAVVNTTGGPVQGLILKTVGISKEYGSFTGIRYGEPPVGYLRFKVSRQIRGCNFFLCWIDCKESVTASSSG